MEWPLSRVPFASIVVDEEDGGNIDVAEAHQVEAGHTGDALTNESEAVHAMLEVAPSPASNGSRTGRNGQVTHGLRLALSGAAAMTSADSNTCSSSSPSDGKKSLSRTLHLRSTAGPSQAATETPLPLTPQREPPTESTSRRRTLKGYAKAEETVTRTVSSLKKAAAVTHRSVDRESSSCGGNAAGSVAGRRTHERSVQQSEAFAARTAPRPVASPPSSSPLMFASAEERAAEAHRLAVRAARPSCLSVCFDWWMYLCYYDTHALFTSQATAFEAPLRRVATASASVFYGELTRCFAAWRRQNWNSLVVLRGADPGDAGARRRGTATAQRVVCDLTLLEYANAVWYESLRVQRLMVQQLLSGNNGGWLFAVGCLDALLTALGAPPSVESPLCPGPPGSATVMPPYRVAPAPLSGMAGTAANSPTTLVTVIPNDVAVVPPPADGLSIRIPTATRMLSLLHVLDVLWSTLPTSIPFRMPVSEMEAPGYYRSTRDPVSLCQLYEEAFCGMTAPTHRACVRQRAHITRRLLEAQACSPGRISSGDTIGEEVQSCFFSHMHLRERLTTLKTNCDDYNGGGSELSKHASALLSAGVKTLRDAQAAEDSGTAYQGRGVDAQQVREEAFVKEAPLAASDEHAAQKLDAASAHFLEDLASLFPPSEATAVVPPNLRPLSSTSEHTAGINSASGHGEGSPHKRVLHLPTASPNDAVSSTSPHTPTRELKDFWVQCDKCDVWHKLATPLNPVPDTWTCRCLGLSCSPGKKRKANRRTLKKATTEGAKRPKTPAGRQRRARDSRKTDATGAAPNAVAVTPCNLGEQGDAHGGDENGDIPLFNMFPVATETATVGTSAKPLKRRRSTPRKRRTTRHNPKKAHAVASTSSSSSSSSWSSSSTSSSDNGSSSSSRSDSSNSGADSDSGLSDGDRGRGAAAQPLPPAPRKKKLSAVCTHKLPRSATLTSATAVASKATGASASQTTSTTLMQLMQAVAELEKRPLHENPFDQLEEIKRLEKRLSAMD